MNIFLDTYDPTTIYEDYRKRNTISGVNVILEQHKVPYPNWRGSGAGFIRELFRHSDILILVYDVSNTQSFNVLRDALKNAEKFGVETTKVVKAVIGSKIDINRSQWAVQPEEGLQLCKEIGASFHQCSAKNSSNVRDAFHHLMREVLV